MVLPVKSDALEIGGSGLLISKGNNELVWIGSGADDPSLSPGIEAPLGSIYCRTNGSKYNKFDTADTDWEIEIVSIPDFIISNDTCLLFKIDGGFVIKG